MVLHGYRGNSEISREYGWEKVADREGILVAYPFAPGEEWSIGMNFPNTSDAIRDRDDLGYLSDTITSLVADHSADAKAIFVAGQSRGGIMAMSLVCHDADRLAGIALVSSWMSSTQLQVCHPSKAVPFLLVVGSRDTILRPIGGKDYAIPGADGQPVWLADFSESLGFWQRRNGCDPNTVEVRQFDNLSDDPSNFTVTDFASCKTAPVRGIMVDGMGHRWPGTDFQERVMAARSGTDAAQSASEFLGPSSFELNGRSSLVLLCRSAALGAVIARSDCERIDDIDRSRVLYKTRPVHFGGTDRTGDRGIERHWSNPRKGFE